MRRKLGLIAIPVAATDHTIDEAALNSIALGEIAFFHFGAFLEARSRQSLQTSDL